MSIALLEAGRGVRAAICEWILWLPERGGGKIQASLFWHSLWPQSLFPRERHEMDDEVQWSDDEAVHSLVLVAFLCDGLLRWVGRPGECTRRRVGWANQRTSAELHCRGTTVPGCKTRQRLHAESTSDLAISTLMRTQVQDAPEHSATKDANTWHRASSSFARTSKHPGISKPSIRS